MMLASALITLMVLVTVMAIAACVQSGRDSREEESIPDEEPASALEGAIARELSDIRFGAAE